jgi:membrane protein
MPYGVSTKQFLRDLQHEIGEDNVYNGAAALGFYFTLAIFPALIFLMSLIPYLPIERVDQAVMDLLRQSMPPEAAKMLSGVVTEVTTERRGGLLSFGALATLWATSSGMYGLMQQLNITYGVKEARSFIRARMVALLLSIAFIVLVIGGFSLIVLGGIIQDWMVDTLGFGTVITTLFSVLRWVLIVAGLLLAFALIYRYAPNVQQRFRFITPGSIIGGLLLVLASAGFALYTTNFADYNATYGSIGAVIILMLWLYIAGLVILLGSEINVVLERYAPSGKNKGERKPHGSAFGREPGWRWSRSD